MNHMRGLREIEPGAAGLEREHEERRAVVALERLDQPAPPRHRRAAVQNQAGPTEDARQKRGERFGHLAVLREDQRLVLPLGERFAQRAQPRELAAARLGEIAVTESLRRMVADLLEARQRGQDHGAALHRLRPGLLFQLFLELLDLTGVERGLRRGEPAVGRHHGLLRQVGDHAAVGLETPQDVGARQAAHRRVGVGHLFAGAQKGGEALGPAEQAGVDEIKQRPEVARAVLDRRAGQRQTRRRLQALDRARLARLGVLDRLRLVQDRQPPRHALQPRGARGHAVRGDHQVDALEPGGGIGLAPFEAQRIGVAGGMHDQQAQ